MFQQLLKKYGLTYDQLNQAERDTLNQWVDSLRTKTITLEDVKERIAALIRGVESELSTLPEATSLWSRLFHQDKTVYLRARLANYLMLESFLLGPERAQKWLEAHLEHLESKNH
jgi:hypothetical protein